jgi:hypothetical protein
VKGSSCEIKRHPQLCPPGWYFGWLGIARRSTRIGIAADRVFGCKGGSRGLAERGSPCCDKDCDCEEAWLVKKNRAVAATDTNQIASQWQSISQRWKTLSANRHSQLVQWRQEWLCCVMNGKGVSERDDKQRRTYMRQQRLTNVRTVFLTIDKLSSPKKSSSKLLILSDDSKTCAHAMSELSECPVGET